MNLLRVHAVPLKDVIKDDLSEGDVIVTGDPITRAVGIVTVSAMPKVCTGSVARSPMIPEVKKST